MKLHSPQAPTRTLNQWSHLSPELQATMVERQLVTENEARTGFASPPEKLNAPPSNHYTAQKFVSTRATGMRPAFMCMGAGPARTGAKSTTDVSRIDVGKAERDTSAVFQAPNGDG
jgi:hypothetical protein